MNSFAFMSMLLFSSTTLGMPNGYSYTNYPSQASEYYSVMYGDAPHYDSGYLDNQPSTDTYWDPTLAPSYPYGRSVSISGADIKTDPSPSSESIQAGGDPSHTPAGAGSSAGLL
ncbi:hypothetical protein PGTUg99_035508 [Puccinia graminis f. sp. tritici]|uniref:Uncharacterized protein n=1 Tax=Puccinia graminis f. sp. tritici TaxID=56615 RepID=A0A5B0Q9N3_PUCGR|nr:hypothetical protein PGTUg99_035508 [Puccinia graminis f. sp. tritici]